MSLGKGDWFTHDCKRWSKKVQQYYCGCW